MIFYPPNGDEPRAVFPSGYRLSDEQLREAFAAGDFYEVPEGYGEESDG